VQAPAPELDEKQDVEALEQDRVDSQEVTSDDAARLLA
jgi:hypothetical protein